jgi:hypothetical protein
MILIRAKLATDRSKAGDGGLLMTRNQRLDVQPTFLLGKNATAVRPSALSGEWVDHSFRNFRFPANRGRARWHNAG